MGAARNERADTNWREKGDDARMNEKGTIRRGNGRRGRRRRRARMPKGPRAGGSSTSSAIVGVCVIALALDSKATTQCPPALPASPVQILFAAAATAPASQPHSQPSCSGFYATPLRISGPILAAILVSEECNECAVGSLRRRLMSAMCRRAKTASIVGWFRGDRVIVFGLSGRVWWVSRLWALTVSGDDGCHWRGCRWRAVSRSVPAVGEWGDPRWILRLSGSITSWLTRWFLHCLFVCLLLLSLFFFSWGEGGFVGGIFPWDSECEQGESWLSWSIPGPTCSIGRSRLTRCRIVILQE